MKRTDLPLEMAGMAPHTASLWYLRRTYISFSSLLLLLFSPFPSSTSCPPSHSPCPPSGHSPCPIPRLNSSSKMPHRYCVGTTFLAVLLSAGSAVRWLGTRPASNPLHPFHVSAAMAHFKRSAAAHAVEILDDEATTIFRLFYILGGVFAGSIIIVSLGNVYLIWRARNNHVIRGTTSRTGNRRSTGSPTERTSLLSGSDRSNSPEGSEPRPDPFVGVDANKIVNRPELERGNTLPIRLRMHTHTMSYAEAMAFVINEPASVDWPVTSLHVQPPRQRQTLEATVTECEPPQDDEDKDLVPSGSLSPNTEETPLLPSTAAFVLTHITYDRATRAAQGEEATSASDEPGADTALATPEGSPDLATPSTDEHAVLSVAPVPEWRHSWDNSEWTGTEIDESTQGVAINTGDSDHDDTHDLLSVTPPPGTPLPSYDSDASRPPSYVYEFAPLAPGAEQRPRRIIVSQGTVDQDGMVTGLRPRVSCGDIINMDTYERLVRDGVPTGDAIVAAVVPHVGEPPVRRGPLGMTIVGATTYTPPHGTVPFTVASGSRNSGDRTSDRNSDRNSLFFSSEEGSDGDSVRLSRSLDERRLIPHEPRQRRLAMSLQEHQVPDIGARPFEPLLITGGVRARQSPCLEPAEQEPAANTDVETGHIDADGGASPLLEASSAPDASEAPGRGSAQSDVDTIYVNGNSTVSSSSSPRETSMSQTAEGHNEVNADRQVDTSHDNGDNSASPSASVAPDSEIPQHVPIPSHGNNATTHVNGNVSNSESDVVSTAAHEVATVSDEDITPMAVPIALPSVPPTNGVHQPAPTPSLLPYDHPDLLMQNVSVWSDSSTESTVNTSSDEGSHHGSSTHDSHDGGHGNLPGGDNGYDPDSNASISGSSGEESSQDEHDSRRDSGIA